MTTFRIWFTYDLKLMIVPGIILFFSSLTIVMGCVVTRKQPDSITGTTTMRQMGKPDVLVHALFKGV